MRQDSDSRQPRFDPRPSEVLPFLGAAFYAALVVSLHNFLLSLLLYDVTVSDITGRRQCVSSQRSIRHIHLSIKRLLYPNKVYDYILYSQLYVAAFRAQNASKQNCS